MSMNLGEQFQKMSIGEKIILIAAPLLLINSFLPWYDVDFGFGSVTRNGWESPGAIWSILALLLSLVAFGRVALINFTQMEIPSDFGNPNVTWGRIHLGLGGLSALCIVIKLINESSYLGFGFYIGIVLVAALAAGAYLIFQEEQKGGGPATSGGGAPPPSSSPPPSSPPSAPPGDSSPGGGPPDSGGGPPTE